MINFLFMTSEPRHYEVAVKVGLTKTIKAKSKLLPMIYFDRKADNNCTNNNNNRECNNNNCNRNNNNNKSGGKETVG